MKYRLYILFVLLLAVSSFITACRNNNSNSNRIAKESKRIAEENNEVKFDNAGETDAQRMVELAALGYTELEMAKAARQKSNNKEVDRIAAQLLADHKMLMKDLKQLAANRNISIPDSATEDEQEPIQKMVENNNPAEFDKKWCTELLNQHEQMISKMEEDATTARDPALRAWINDALPRIRVHRDKLMQLKYKLR
jgi:putative membrane protein